MGSTNSAAKEYSQDGLRRFTQNFQFLRTQNDSRFGTDVMIYYERSSKKLIGILHKATEDSSFTESFRNELKHRLTLDHKNLARIVGFTKSEDETMCGSSHQLSVFNEFYDSDLDSEIKDRVGQKDYFQESEIWYVANSLISLGSYFQQNGIYHGDIRPHNLLMDEEGSVFQFDHGLLNPSKDNLNKAFAGDKSVYLSPRQLEVLRAKSAKAEFDTFKSDVFSAGLTLLHMSRLESPLPLYNFSNQTFDKEGLKKAIAEVEQGYSKPLADLIAWMTETEEIVRPDFITLNNTLQSQGKALSMPQNPSVPVASPNKSFRNNASPANVHNDLSNSNGKKANPLTQSHVSNAQNIIASPVSLHNSNLAQSGVGLIQSVPVFSPYRSAIVDPNLNFRQGNLYNYPAHYYLNK